MQILIRMDLDIPNLLYVPLLGLSCHKMPLLGLFSCNPDPDPDFCSRCRFWSGWTQIYLTYCNVPLLSLIYPNMALFGLFWCNPDPNLDLWTRCRFWWGWTQIYQTYCNVLLLSLICPKIALFGLFWCNPDPDLDLWTRCRFWSGWTQIYQTYCNVSLLALKCHYLANVAVIRIQIRILYPDADFDQDGPRHTELTVMYHYWALFVLKCHY